MIVFHSPLVWQDKKKVSRRQSNRQIKFWSSFFNHWISLVDSTMSSFVFSLWIILIRNFISVFGISQYICKLQVNRAHDDTEKNSSFSFHCFVVYFVYMHLHVFFCLLILDQQNQQSVCTVFAGFIHLLWWMINYKNHVIQKWIITGTAVYLALTQRA